MTDKTKTEHADRTVGGPGSSHQDAGKPETHHHRARERDQQKGSSGSGEHQGKPDGGERPSGRHGPEAPRHPKE